MIRLLILLIGFWFSTAALAEPVYVVLFMHNEDGVLADLDQPGTRASYMRHRRELVEFADTLAHHHVPFCWQSDFKFLQAILKYDTPAVMDSTDGKNLARYLAENCGITVEAHSHENYGYNYADVAHLIDSLGVTPTDVVGGHVWDPYLANYADWERFRTPLQGSMYPHAQWDGRLLIGSATPGHSSDPVPSGVWRPLDKYNFWTDDPQGNIICIGQYKNDLEGVEELVQIKQSGAVSDNEILTCAVFSPQSANPDFTQDYVQTTLTPLLNLQDQGKIKLVTFTDVVDIWDSKYNARAHIYNPPPDSVPQEFSVRIPSDAGEIKVSMR
ncbi:MAG: hypothetical protein U5R06_22995 [candidate division KSB1 bacterium]|nr:hypothetical protein [candidate division KSB1 bacterium]